MPRSVEFRPGFHAHASGTLWLPDAGALVVADAHLGYAWAQRRRGELGPLAEGGAKAALVAVLEELRPSTVVFAGDLVHAPRPCADERAAIEDTLRAAASLSSLVVVLGNHDRGLMRDFCGLPVTCMQAWHGDGVTVVHGDRLEFPLPENHYAVLGHFHPTLPFKDAAGVRRRLRIFLAGRSACILPAFSPFAAGCDLLKIGLPSGLKGLLGARTPEAVAVTGRSAAAIGPVRRLRFV
ncbi:MAG: metallophosphoesterase [Bryobacteraceae bacterium]|nr:metallophosphoesterase [Bryobacteraceae bacterium]